MTTTTTLSRDTERLMHLNVRQFTLGANTMFNISERRENGTGLVTGTPVFKVGTFRDSLGIQHTWNPEHLEQMVFHFNMLKGNLTLPNVPWRADHSSSVRNVVGYITGLNFEGGLLLADWEVVDPDALVQMDLGKFRARSAEVGLYETNDEAFYWPVLMGVAFVDLPAVEGLYAQADRQYTALFDKEIPVTTPSATTTTNPPAATVPTPPAPVVTPPAASNTPPAPAPPATPPAAPPTPPAPSDPGAPANPPAPTTHAGPSTATLFVNGTATTDPVAIQAHITALETYRAESSKAAREAFVKGLVTAGKLAAPQVDTQIAFVHTLNDSQYDAFMASWAAAPTSSLFARHGAGVANPTGDAPEGPGEKATLEEILAMHKRGGMSQDQIEKTDSFKKLAALNAAGK